MKTYKIIIEETLSREVKVKAESLDDAMLKTKQDYDKEIIVLDYDDYEDVKFYER